MKSTGLKSGNFKGSVDGALGDFAADWLGTFDGFADNNDENDFDDFDDDDDRNVDFDDLTFIFEESDFDCNSWESTDNDNNGDETGYNNDVGDCDETNSQGEGRISASKSKSE